MRVARTLAPVLAATLVGVGLTGPLAPPAYAEVGECSGIADDATDVDPVPTSSAPLDQLRIEEATALLEREGRRPGQGIGVAVVDSGVDDDADVNEVRALPRNPEFSRTGESIYYHGTAVAGLIAGAPRPGESGPVGIAPAAAIYDVRVYDAPEDDDEGDHLGLTDAGVIDGLNRIADDLTPGRGPRIRIVNVSLALQPSDALERAVERLSDRGVVVVAAAGNRPVDEADPVLGDFAGEERAPGEDAARVVFPAGYEPVVAATSSVPRGVDPADVVVPNSASDIAVPTFDGVSYSLTGQTCLLPAEDAATSWAAAEVSGLLALLMSAYDEPPGRAVERLYRTATGAGGVTTRFTGHGVAQPVEALRRPITFRKGGVPETSETNDTVPKARATRPEADVLEETRRDAVWWGLAGGGALVIALLLRPLLARRRGDR